MRINKIFFICLLFLFSSCITNHDLEYVRKYEEFDAKNTPIKPYRLEIGDLISVQISTTTEQQHDFFNKEKVNNSQLLVQNPYLYGYLIKEDGCLDLPSFGKIKAEGFTLNELEVKIKDIAISYFEQPVVKLNIINFDITILGEVNNPGTFSIKDSKVNVLYALSLAGDLKTTANRRKVKIIRNQNNENKIIYLDLTKKDILKNNDIMLKSHDIVYIAPLKKRFYVLNNITNIISLSLSAMSLYLLITTR